MAEMTDPTPAMVSFQQALRRGEITLQRADLDADVFAHMDPIPGGARFSYARLSGTLVLAFANFVTAGFENMLPVFQVGVAVPETERGKGRAKHIMSVGIAEMKHGFSRARPGSGFYVEAVVGLDNLASQRVAAAVINDCPKPITDEVSGLPAFHYIRRIV